MPKMCTELTEIMFFAEEKGFASWNQLCDILEPVRPQYECKIMNRDYSDFAPSENCEDDEDNEYGYTEELKDIMRAFMDKHKMKSISIIDN